MHMCMYRHARAPVYIHTPINSNPAKSLSRDAFPQHLRASQNPHQHRDHLHPISARHLLRLEHPRRVSSARDDGRGDWVTGQLAGVGERAGGAEGGWGRVGWVWGGGGGSIGGPFFFLILFI